MSVLIKGRKVYDPLTNKWSTGYWVIDDKGNLQLMTFREHASYHMKKRHEERRKVE